MQCEIVFVFCPFPHNDYTSEIVFLLINLKAHAVLFFFAPFIRVGRHRENLKRTLKLMGSIFYGDKNTSSQLPEETQSLSDNDNDTDIAPYFTLEGDGLGKQQKSRRKAEHNTLTGHSDLVTALPPTGVCFAAKETRGPPQKTWHPSPQTASHQKGVPSYSVRPYFPDINEEAFLTNDDDDDERPQGDPQASTCVVGQLQPYAGGSPSPQKHNSTPNTQMIVQNKVRNKSEGAKVTPTADSSSPTDPQPVNASGIQGSIYDQYKIYPSLSPSKIRHVVMQRRELESAGRFPATGVSDTAFDYKDQFENSTSFDSLTSDPQYNMDEHVEHSSSVDGTIFRPPSGLLRSVLTSEQAYNGVAGMSPGPGILRRKPRFQPQQQQQQRHQRIVDSSCVDWTNNHEMAMLNKYIPDEIDIDLGTSHTPLPKGDLPNSGSNFTSSSLPPSYGSSQQPLDGDISNGETMTSHEPQHRNRSVFGQVEAFDTDSHQEAQKYIDKYANSLSIPKSQPQKGSKVRDDSNGAFKPRNLMASHKRGNLEFLPWNLNNGNSLEDQNGHIRHWMVTKYENDCPNQANAKDDILSDAKGETCGLSSLSTPTKDEDSLSEVSTRDTQQDGKEPNDTPAQCLNLKGKHKRHQKAKRPGAIYARQEMEGLPPTWETKIGMDCSNETRNNARVMDAIRRDATNDHSTAVNRKNLAKQSHRNKNQTHDNNDNDESTSCESEGALPAKLATIDAPSPLKPPPVSDNISLEGTSDASLDISEDSEWETDSMCTVHSASPLSCFIASPPQPCNATLRSPSHSQVSTGGTGQSPSKEARARVGSKEQQSYSLKGTRNDESAPQQLPVHVTSQEPAIGRPNRTAMQGMKKVRFSTTVCCSTYD